MFIPAKGTAGLIAMAGFVAVILYFIPATRWFLLFSVPVGVVVALLLSFWHKRRPVEAEPENKRPLGL